MLLKLSPDIEAYQLESILEISLKIGIDGWVLSNTTVSRPTGYHQFPTEGGLSGKPLGELSKELLGKTIKILGDRRKGKLIVSSGGILTPLDVIERLGLGADVIQIYSGLGV